MQPNRARIIDLFLEDAKEQLADIKHNFLNLQSTLEDREKTNQIFRATFGLKGGAAMLGFTTLQKTVFRIEECLRVFQENFYPVRVDQKLELLLRRIVNIIECSLDELVELSNQDEQNKMMLAVEPVFEEIYEHWRWLINQILTPKAIATNNLNQPLPDDAVLGGRNYLVNAAVLGGIEGIKQRLTKGSENEQIIALTESLKYGKAGFKLIIEALTTKSLPIKLAAYDLLWSKATLNQKEIIKKYNYLLCSHGIDYSKLRYLLSEGKWKEADEETATLLFKSSNRDTLNNGFSNSDMPNQGIELFTDPALSIIDKLWGKYSFGYYGFSVQKRIWLSVEQNSYEFKKLVGWYFGDSSDRSIQTQQYQCPQGYLPYKIYKQISLITLLSNTKL